MTDHFCYTRPHGVSILNIADALLVSGDGGWFSVLVYYGDDSGSHGKGPFVVAGYLGRARDWFYLGNDWAKVLHEPPAIEYFKMAECYRLKGQFASMSRSQADAKLSRLIDVVDRYKSGFAEMSSMVNWEDYHSVIGEGAFREEFHNPYLFCLHGVVSQTAKFLDRIKSNEMINYVFDHQSNLNFDSAKQYYFVRETAPKELTRFMGSISFEDDLHLRPLQVADLIAWHVRRGFAKPPEDNGRERPELSRLRDGVFLSECAVLRSSAIAQLVVDLEAQLEANRNLQNREEIE